MSTSTLSSASADQALYLFPASFAQQGMWFLDQLEPNSAAYNLPASLRLNMALDVAALERSLNVLIQRHEALRTTFVAVDGQPSQVIAPSLALSLPLVDLSSLPTAQREAETLCLANEQVQRPFDLARGPLLRTLLLQLAAGEYILLLTIHHIISDGWSIGVLFQELATLYTAFATSKPSPLPELPIQYVDFALWQQELLQEGALADQRAYWKQQLAGAPALLDLPTDRPHPPVPSLQGSVQLVLLPSELSEALKALSRREGVSLYMTLVAAFQALLYRYSGQEDLVLGTFTAGRTQVETEALIGFFVNTLLLRTDLSGNPTFRDLLGRVREVILEAYAHQEVPFDLLVRDLQPTRTLGQNPLFQVMLTFAPPLPGLPAGWEPYRQAMAVETGAARFDLSLDLADRPWGLICRFEYSTDLFDASTIARMAGHWQTLLQGIVANPSQHLAALPFLTEQERQQLLVEWNDTPLDYPRDACLHQLFEAQVERAPNDVALVCEDERLTYRQLNSQANQLAHYLRQLGVGPEALVGIYVERSLEMVVGLLGILKAGGAYVPLDPSYPSERLAFMLRDAQVAVLLTKQRLLEKLPRHQARAVCLDSDWKTIARESAENLANDITGANLAYMLYTSGSTGRPKGVLGTHRASINRFHWMWRTYPFASGEMCCHKTSLSFVDAIWEIFGPLLQGVRAVIIPDMLVKDPQQLLQTLAAHAVTRLVLVPSLLRVLMDTRIDLQHRLPNLKYWISSGETLPLELARRFLNSLPQSVLINLYGSSEVAADVTCYAISSSRSLTRVPIGRPIANTHIYLLDRHLQLVPIGVMGELHVGGDGLARGYFNSPELTAEKFIPHPFSTEPGARLYKTGDLARYLPDGTIELMGRTDTQVKIRGYRIELGEIEQALGQHPAVREIVVVAQEDKLGDKRLVAYVIPAHERTPTRSELRSYLKAKLPDYMLPVAFVPLEALPLTPNGKLDRRALPAPESSRPILDKAYVAPRTDVEKLLAGIWATVLKLEQVGIHDNFFELGGHSLLATLVISRSRTAFQMEVPLRLLFEAPTLADLADSLEASRHSGQSLQIPPLQPAARVGKLPLSFAQQRLWFLDQLEPESTAYNLRLAMRLTGPLHIEALEQSLNTIVQRHEALRTTFVTLQDTPVQVIASMLSVPLPVIDLESMPTSERDERAQQLAGEEAEQPFNLARGPLVRTHLLRLGASEHMFLLSMHHIVSDGWSMSVFCRELAALYAAFCSGKPSPLPVLSIQYADFALWQREWLQGAILDAELAYWKQQLHAAPPVLHLPTDRRRPPLQSFEGAAYRFLLLPPLREAVQTLSRREGVTLFMTLLAAFQGLLARYSGQDDIVVGTPIANRTQIEIEGLIGFFVNTLVLRTNLSGDPTVREVLQRVREVALGAYAHQETPFEQIVEALQPQRDLSRNPLFQVLFVLQNAPDSTLELAGLTLDALEVESRTARFDLTLSVGETEQGLLGVLEYNTDLFEAATISRMVGHFQTILEGMVVAPEQRFSSLPFLTASERQQVLVEWNATPMDYPKDVCLHQLFEAQAQRTPEAVALVFEDQQLTYHELNWRANQLAHYLQKRGVGPEVLVGICLERSIAMVVGLLGILKAGGAYVPLDPTYPQQRLVFMLEDAQMAVLLTQQWVAQALATYAARPIYLDSDWESIAQESRENSVSGITSSNLAYVIYTSGSTGKPKGVQILHQAVVNFLTSIRQQPGMTAHDTLLSVTTLSFDIAALELFLPLTVGAKLVLMSHIVASDGAQLGALLAISNATILQATPATWRLLLAAGWQGGDRLKLLCGGEALSRELAQTLLERGASLWNLYGPTETTIWSTLTRVEDGGGPVFIGHPIANTQIYLLDSWLGLVPIGISGEVYIGGAGIARGYLGRPDLTMERFIPHPYSIEPGARLYRTGDLARYHSDGSIEYLGRTDFQVKIRGFRIELGEIEAVLARHPALRQVVVVAHEDEAEHKRLVAYVVPNHEATPTHSELRGFLQEKLPDYMLPTAFVPLGAVPLTPNGKLDRRALPAPERSRPALDKAYVAPRTPVEQRLAEIWASLLMLEQVGIHDNFFELGGHSFLSLQLTSRVQATFQVELPLRTIFEFPSVAQFAAIIELRQRNEQALQADVEHRDLPLSLIRNVILAVVAALLVAWISTFSPFHAVVLIVALILGALVALEIWFLVRAKAHLELLLARLESLEKHGVRLADHQSLAQDDQFFGLKKEQDAPHFELPDIFTGEMVSLSDLLPQDPGSHKPVVLVFSSPHCAPCNAMIPEYMQWVKRYGDRVTIAMITEGTAQENRARFAHYAEKPLVLLQKEKKIADAYKVRSTPTAVCILFDGSIDSQAEGKDHMKLLLLEASVCWPGERNLRLG